MRNLAVLAVGAIALTCTLNSVQAQNNFGATDSHQQESVVYTLELTEQMIEDLRNGQSLRSEIPLHLRNKVTEVRLRLASGDRTANANAANGVQNSGNSSISNPFNNNSSRGFQSGQGSNRTDSLVLPRPPANSVLQPRPSSGTPTTPPQQRSVPRFDPNKSSFGDQSSNNGYNNSMNRGSGQNVSRYDQPLGPPNPYATPQQTRNPYANQNLPQTRQPATNPGGFQPAQRQPASTQPSSNQYSPARPGNPQMRPSAPSGTEYDTTWNRQRNDDRGYAPNHDQNRVNPNWNQQASQPPQDGFRPAYPENRLASNENRVASNQTDNNGNWQDGHRNYQQVSEPQYNRNQPRYQPREAYIPGHDVPMISNQLPQRIASRAAQEHDHVHSNQNLTASIPGDQKSADGYVAVNDGPNGVPNRSPVSQLNQFNSFLYFLLLCSIGLNIYLAWISRGFYVRYRELADELRDTFSTAA